MAILSLNHRLLILSKMANRRCVILRVSTKKTAVMASLGEQTVFLSIFLTDVSYSTVGRRRGSFLKPFPEMKCFSRPLLFYIRFQSSGTRGHMNHSVRARLGLNDHGTTSPYPQRFLSLAFTPPVCVFHGWITSRFVIPDP